ncbi:hypothetical protein [Rheinheimera maricola]|uniref:Type II secretion system protein GspC N-terminal domain-containing protein n=1 Tax=Rheinheimera maricola TaxID=2793282 RepID=A0ABS7X572_9GAMM|nr:hypothetical protein [Rheinheimera maricola]MBZ9610290.1 hypothetical protein [Rheinheimera maricola]
MSQNIAKYFIVAILITLLAQAWQLWSTAEQSQIATRATTSEARRQTLLVPPAFEFNNDKLSMFFGVEPVAELATESNVSKAEQINFRLVAVDKREDGFRAVIDASSTKQAKQVFVRQGDVIEGFTVQSVSAKEVILVGDEQVTLKLFSLPEANLAKGS